MYSILFSLTVLGESEYRRSDINPASALGTIPSLSFITNSPISPPMVGIIPIITKNFFQSSTVASALVKLSKPPNTTASASKGITARMVSTLLLLAVLVTSVIQVL